MLSLSGAFLKPMRALSVSVELLAQPIVMAIDRALDLGRPAKAPHDTGKPRFDRLVAQHEVGAHGPDGSPYSLVAKRVRQSGPGEQPDQGASVDRQCDQ